ncbi:glycosyltransferase family 39 protein [Ruminococcus albus]|uniref:Uncharacterized protein n=1 Tax=Ruminococcus albus (strain ATCC 27210 / DSM 20455 / JCM 14654 / NCDO 2250 / 7) TaxID=697329 RepID=E6UE94_RUMA7|nr:glycosyltransferase family 39 protein [Ruminococcus albus]ADU23484.1 hypothetical protein Rumal_3019 [Ruminococcus albus 7 = DSM 20455]
MKKERKEITFPILNKMIENGNDRVFSVVLFLASLLVRANTSWNIIRNIGIHYGGDFVRFQEWELELDRLGMKFFSEYNDIPYYWGFTLLLHAVKKLTGGYSGIIVVNVLMTSAAVIFLYKTAKIVTKSKTIALLAGLEYVYCPKLMEWNNALTSDAIAIFIGAVCFYYYYKYTRVSKARKDLVILSLICLLYYFERTTAVITIIFICAGLIKQKFSKNRKMILILSVAAAVGMLAVGIILLKVSHGEHGVVSRIKYYIGLFESGTIVYETNTFVYNADPSHFGKPIFALDILAIIALRAVFFWSVAFIRENSIFEVVMGYITFLPLIVTGFLGIITSFRKKNKELYSMFVFILMTNLTQACFEIDGGLRYRMPVLPFMIVFSSYFVFTAARLFSERAKSKDTAEADSK